MTDEKFTFVSDVRDKKRTARGAFNKRTHAGKGGAVRFPSDYLTRKERNAMNGEVQTYSLNSRMTWKEFRAMPEDIQILYIKALRDKFSVPDSKIGEMMGADKDQVSRHFKKIGLGGNCTRKRKNWDADGWHKWLNGIHDPKAESATVIPDISEPVEAKEPEVQPEPEPEEQVVREAPKTQTTSLPQAVPTFGTLTFTGSAESALKLVEQILGGALASITISWDIIPAETKGGGVDG